VSDFTTNLLTGLAVYLAAHSIGTWSPTGAYTVLQTGIILGNIPQSPDRIVALAAYPVSDSPSLSDSVIGVQIKCRWGGADPRPVDDLADSIFSLLHGSQQIALSTGVTIVQCRRNSGAPLGMDVNERWSNVANYYVTVLRPSANRL
jgi:hypothetical protein